MTVGQIRDTGEAAMVAMLADGTAPVRPCAPGGPLAMGSLDSFRDMFRSSGDWFRGADDDPYAVHIIVRESRSDGAGGTIRPSEADATEAAALGLLAMLSQHGDDGSVSRRIAAWCSARIRKIVRRAGPSRWEAIAYEAASSQGVAPGATVPSPWHGAVLVDGAGETGAAVIVVPPMRASSMPRSLARLRVRGLSLPADGDRRDPGGLALRVVIEASAGMTSGKAIAQACHAVQIATRELGDGRWREWEAAGFPTVASRGGLEGLCAARMPDAAVTDAGFTEVRPGTRTCAAWLSPDPLASVEFA